MNQEKLEWEDKIDAMFIEGNMKFAGVANATPENIKSFIKNLLSQERERIIEKIKTNIGTSGSGEFGRGYDIALIEILEELK